MISIDFHSHIIPGADHGSDSLATSSVQIESSLKRSIDKIICTPHFYPHIHNVKAFIKRRDKGFAELEKFVNDKKLNIKLIKAAEVLICDNLQNLPNIKRLCIEGTHTLLLELPFTALHHEYIESCENLIEAGYNVLIAHADRYPPEDIERILETGAKLQLNAESLVGLFPRRHLFDWIEREEVVALGSDLHMKNFSAHKKYALFRKKHPQIFEHIMELGTRFVFDK